MSDEAKVVKDYILRLSAPYMLVQRILIHGIAKNHDKLFKGDFEGIKTSCEKEKLRLLQLKSWNNYSKLMDKHWCTPHPVTQVKP